jgi:hypothetical protein
MVPVLRKHPRIETAIDENAILRVLENRVAPDAGQIAETLAKARALQGLDEPEVAALLLVSDEEQTAIRFSQPC